MLKVRLNLRKVATIVSCLAVTTMFSGCDDKENQPEIKVENEASRSQTVYADQTEGKSGVTIVTAGAWSSTITEGSVKSTKAGAVTWLSIAPSSGGAGTHTIIISLEPNATGSDRAAIITITCNGETITITVTQTATKANGESYAAPPVLTTVEATDITATSATVGGNITDAGTPAYTERGVCFATTATPTVENNKIAFPGSGTGSFTFNLAALTPNTTYYMRAYATNDNGTVYGNEVSFTTLTAEPEKVKLLETISEDGGHYTTTFEYDNQNRIIKISYYNYFITNDRSVTFTYNANDLVKTVEKDNYETRTEEFLKSGNKITMTQRFENNPQSNATYTIDLNEDGTMAKFQIDGSDNFFTYQYDNGNLTNDGQYAYLYDNNKSPFFYSNTPKWFMVYFFDDVALACKNNTIEKSGLSSDERYTYEYEYDKDGFPTKRIEKREGFGESVIEFAYK